MIAMKQSEVNQRYVKEKDNTGKYAVIWLVAIALILSACSSTGSGKGNSADGKEVIKIGYLPITHAAPLYIEEEINNGSAESPFKLQLVKFGSWPDLMDALNTGKVDGASVLIELAMRAKEQGVDLTAVALGHKDGNVVVTALDIEKTEDLKGKTFAIPHKYSTHNVLLYLMLKQAGMAYTDVDVVQLPPAEMPVALAEGRIAGYIVAEPFGAKAVAMSKGKVLFQSEELWPDSVDCALVLRSKWLQEKPEVAEQFVKQYVEAGVAAEAKDEDTKQVLKKFMNIDDQVLNLSLEWIKYNELKLDEASYELLRQYMIEMELSDNPPLFSEFVDNSWIEKVS